MISLDKLACTFRIIILFYYSLKHLLKYFDTAGLFFFVVISVQFFLTERFSDFSIENFRESIIKTDASFADPEKISAVCYRICAARYAFHEISGRS